MNNESLGGPGPGLVENKERILPHRLVVKFGTKSLCSSDNQEERLNQGIFDDFGRQIVWLQQQGVQVIVVSSGATQAGKEYAKEQKIGISQMTKSALAGMGQPHLMKKWDEAIKRAGGKGVAQLLVTYTNWSNEKERRKVTGHIFEWLSQDITPIINENDSVADKEIELWEQGISENDRLAGLVARKIGADAILFLTEEGGIYTDDPKSDPRARLFEEIPAREKNWTGDLAVTFGQSTKGKNQGMREKWIEASRCFGKGRNMVAIAGSNERNVISRFAIGEFVGTRIGTTPRLK